MSIKKIFGNQFVPPAAQAKGAKKAEAQKTQGTSQKDRVDFSDVLKGVSKTKEASSVMDPQRSERIARIKEQVAEGSYRPDLNKVAESLLNFIREDEV